MKPNILILLGFAVLCPTYILLLRQPPEGEGAVLPKFEVRKVYLKRFAVDKLKIDQSFVRDVPGDADDEAIISAIINLACSLNIQCIAEGVETQAQADFLQAMSCAEAQGYLFAKPLPVDQFESFLRGIQ